ncbi:hypothetical protein DRQ17_04880 [bacterium]|nr:MAG: hypothetical protein DRQ17_04880 [bacterium]RKZ22435.1 MAG: hypothetical protein DRQ23_05130 [bacterium]
MKGLLKGILKTSKHWVKVFSCIYRHPDTPRFARFILWVIIIYALSPVDIIPDWIPLLGQLDDLIIISFGILIVSKFISRKVLTECREKALTGEEAGEWEGEEKERFLAHDSISRKNMQ